jgi:hypothetical protein
MLPEIRVSREYFYDLVIDRGLLIAATYRENVTSRDMAERLQMAEGGSQKADSTYLEKRGT